MKYHKTVKNSLSAGAGAVTLVGAFAMPGLACAPPTRCADVGFASNTDWLAAKVIASGTTCSTARALATAAKQGPGSFTAYGFTCVGKRITTDGAPYTFYGCKGSGEQGALWRLYR